MIHHLMRRTGPLSALIASAMGAIPKCGYVALLLVLQRYIHRPVENEKTAGEAVCNKPEAPAKGFSSTGGTDRTWKCSP